MFRLFYCCASLCLFCAAVSPADAHLYFLPDYKDAVMFGTNIPHNPGTVENTCPDLGYNVTSCPAGYYLSGKCPLSALYYKECLPVGKRKESHFNIVTLGSSPRVTGKKKVGE